VRVPVKWGYGEAPGGGWKLESGRDEVTSKVACITKYLMAMIHKELDEFDLSTPPVFALASSPSHMVRL
jgi:hypothetical protein